MSYGKDLDDPAAQAQWSPMDRAPVLIHSLSPFPSECDLITIGVLTADCVGRDV
jgi:hypothetical protein